MNKEQIQLAEKADERSSLSLSHRERELNEVYEQKFKELMIKEKKLMADQREQLDIIRNRGGKKIARHLRLKSIQGILDGDKGDVLEYEDIIDLIKKAQRNKYKNHIKIKKNLIDTDMAERLVREGFRISIKKLPLILRGINTAIKCFSNVGIIDRVKIKF